MEDRQQLDEQLLIDFFAGQCDGSQREQVRQRLTNENSFRQLHDDISHAFSAIRLTPEHEPPEDLVTRTMARIRQARQLDALIARQEMGRGRVLTPTFSLRELAGVAAAVVLLSVLFVPSVKQARRMAHQVQCTSQVGQIGTGLQSYASMHGGAIPVADTPIKRWLPSSQEPAVSNSSALFRLLQGGYVPVGAFVCPAAGGGATFVICQEMRDFPGPAFVNYSYQHTVGPKGIRVNDGPLLAVASKMAILADSTPLFAGGRFQPQRLKSANSENHGGRGQSTLYLDWHVEFVRTPSAGVAGNNIFLAEGIYDYKGVEEPVSPTDSFLLPAYTSSSGPDEN